METQVFVMLSDRILKSAVEDQDVQQTAWAKRFHTSTGFDVAEAHDKIQDIVNVRRVRNTQIIILGARTRVPRDATVIAGTIADTFLSDVRNREIGRVRFGAVHSSPIRVTVTRLEEPTMSGVVSRSPSNMKGISSPSAPLIHPK